MSVLPQHKYPVKSLLHHNAPITCRQRACFLRAAATTTTTRTEPAQNQNKLFLEPRLVNQPSLVVTTPTDISLPSTLNDPSLKSTWAHRAWMACGSTTVLISLAKSVAGAADSHSWLEPVLAGFVGYILADLGSGVYHWGIDNYGNESTPVFGLQIEAFQGHHKWPWVITRRQFSNNLHALARAIALFMIPVDLLCNDPTTHGFVSICAGCIMFSQQFHAWAHSTKSKLPPLVVALQDSGVLVSRSQHGAHHRAPYNNNYCIVSGVWNEFLDKQQVFEALEMVLFFKLGVRPRSWDEPNSEWIEESETTSTQVMMP